MRIIRFNEECIEDAKKLLLENYQEERKIVNTLPEIDCFPKLDVFVKNGLGVAAYKNDRLVGFLCCYKPWNGAFDMEKGLGIYSPLYGHGAIKENRARIYQDMIEEVGKIYSKMNILSFGITLYQHDTLAKEAFFEYGFGSRLSDKIATTAKIVENRNAEYSYQELRLEDFPRIREMRRSLNSHLKNSPCFLQNTKEETDNWLDEVEKGDRRTFVAGKGKLIISYIDIDEQGENFVTYNDKMINIVGAYCQKEYRGMNIARDLLDYVMETMRKEGYQYIGVDHETYNPLANRFWKKYFTSYTIAVVRHIELWSMDK